MIQGPFLVTIVPGGIVFLLTWWLRKKASPTFVRNLPGTLTLLVAIPLIYIGFVRMRGFEGGAYGILVFFCYWFRSYLLILETPRSITEGVSTLKLNLQQTGTYPKWRLTNE